MNLRQKAKHYKKLYETIIPKKPYPVVYVERGAKHYKVHTFALEKEIEFADKEPLRFKYNIVNAIMRELKPYIWDNLIVERDKYTGGATFTLDIWF